MRAERLPPGTVFRRLPHHSWRICLRTQVEKFDLDFVDIVYLGGHGKILEHAYFVDTELEVLA